MRFHDDQACDICCVQHIHNIPYALFQSNRKLFDLCVFKECVLDSMNEIFECLYLYEISFMYALVL